MLASLAETDLQDRAETVEQDIDPATGSHDPLEIGDATSQTNVSFMVTAEELGFSEITAASAPLEPLDETGHALRSADTNSAMAPSPAAAPLPAAAVAPPAPLVRDRPMPKLPISTAPDSLPPPKDGKQQIGPSPACPQCESPMAWVEEHLRFYCKSCRMYF